MRTGRFLCITFSDSWSAWLSRFRLSRSMPCSEWFFSCEKMAHTLYQLSILQSLLLISWLRLVSHTFHGRALQAPSKRPAALDAFSAKYFPATKWGFFFPLLHAPNFRGAIHSGYADGFNDGLTYVVPLPAQACRNLSILWG